MVFNLQLFTTTWKFDSGVGFADSYQTINIKSSGGVGYFGESGNAAVVGSGLSVSAASTWGDIGIGAPFINQTAWSGLGVQSTNALNQQTTTGVTAFIGIGVDAQRNVQGLAMTGVSFGMTGVTLSNGSSAIILSGDYVMSSGARAFGTAIGTSDWSDVFQANTVTLNDNLKFGTNNLTLNIDSEYLGTVELRNKNADLRLTKTRGNSVVVNGISTGEAGVGRYISFGETYTTSLGSADEHVGQGVTFTTVNQTAALEQGSNLTGTTVVGQGNSKLQFIAGQRTGGVLRFGEASDSVYVRKNGANTSVSLAFAGTENANVYLNAGTTYLNGLQGKQNIVFDTSSNTQELQMTNSDLRGGTIANTNKVLINVADHNLDQADIRAGGTFDANGAQLLTLGLSGAGVETVNIGTHGANATADNWVMSGSTPTGAVSSNIVSIGDHGILAVEGDLAGSQNLWVATHWTNSGDADKTGENGDPSRLQITSKADGSADGANMGDYEYMNIAAQGNTYKAMVVSDASLKASDANVNFGVDIVVGDMLNLGDRTDKKVVFLNNGLGKNDWGETVSYSANMTTVKSSTAGGSLIIGDFENSVSLYGAGDQDSLFGGNDYDHDKSATWALSNYDTLASAAKKKAWMGTSEYSGLTLVDLVHNGQQTNNFGFLGENDETEKTGDVLALMHGAGFTSLKGSEHQLVNFAIGADSANHFMFQSVTEGTHDIMYTYDLGKNNYNGRVDTSLLGSKSGFEYDDSIDFYLGFDKGTVLSFDSSDKNQKLNYDGGAVLMGISTIDGSAGGAGNILNGQENHAEYIAGSATAANTLCGGLKGDADTAADTLVGGSAADTFWVGATMGNDVINNVSDGDTIVFLNSKFADATITHNMLVPGDASVYNVSFSDEAGGATVNLNTATGKKLSDFKSLTIKFDDATYAWNGTEWSQS